MENVLKLNDVYQNFRHVFDNQGGFGVDEETKTCHWYALDTKTQCAASAALFPKLKLEEEPELIEYLSDHNNSVPGMLSDTASPASVSLTQAAVCFVSALQPVHDKLSEMDDKEKAMKTFKKASQSIYFGYFDLVSDGVLDDEQPVSFKKENEQ